MLRNAKLLTAKQDTFTQRPATLLTKQLIPGVAWAVWTCTQAKGSVWFGNSKDPATPTLALCPHSFPLQKNQVMSQDQLVSTAEPSLRVRTRLKGMPYFFRIMGEMSVILCLRKASQPCELPGKKPRVEESGVRVGVSVGGGSSCHSCD